MTKRKRQRENSVTAEGEMARAKPPSPPAHIEMPEAAMPHWWAIVRARDYSAWTGPDLEHAANLACCLYDCERLRRELRDEGDTLTNARGTVVMNPKHSLLEQLSRRSVALSRLVHVHAEATAGRSQDDSKRSKKQREMAGAVDKSDDDGLIASPVH